mgnify:CR=1 FL=1|jgi:hypothetical protein
MKKSLLLIPLFFISCEKEVIEPAKYIKIINQGKPATVIVDVKKPFKLRFAALLLKLLSTFPRLDTSEKHLGYIWIFLGYI